MFYTLMNLLFDCKIHEIKFILFNMDIFPHSVNHVNTERKQYVRVTLQGYAYVSLINDIQVIQYTSIKNKINYS